MYGVVNPSDSQNLESYKATIMSYGPAVVPESVGGGEFVRNTGAVTPAPVAAGEKRPTAPVLGFTGAVALALLLA